MSEISRLLIEQGRNAAEGARHSGEIWGNLAQQLGQVPATYGNLKWQAEQRAAGTQERDIAARQRADAEKEKATAKRQQQIGQQAQDMIRLGNMTPESVKSLVDQSAAEFEGDTPNVLRARLTTPEGAQQVAQFLSDRFGATPPGQKLTDHDPTKDLIDPTGRVVRAGVAASPKDRNPLVVKPGEIVLGPDNQPVYTAPNAEVAPKPFGEPRATKDPDGNPALIQQFSDGTMRYVAGAYRDKPVDVLSEPVASEKPPTLGSFEDYVVRYAADKKVSPAALTPAQIEDARKRYQQADDRPRITVNTTAASGDDAKTVAKGIADGSLPPDVNTRTRYGMAVEAELKRQGFDLSKATSDWKATQKHLSTLNGAQQVRMGQAVDNASHSLDVIDNLASKWKGGKFPALNKAQLALAKQGTLGPEAQKIAVQLDAQIADVTSELANVYMGGNSPTDHALTLAAKNLSADWSEATLKAMTDQARQNLRIRQNSMRNVGAAGVSENSPYAAPPPQAPAAPTASGGLSYQDYLNSRKK